MSGQFLRIRLRFRRVLCLLLLPCFSFTAPAIFPQSKGPTPEDQLAQYKDKFDRDSDPIHKAKDLTKLGDAQIAEFTRQATADNIDGAFLTLAAYRVEVGSTFDAMKATGIDAERKPDGFKELQIHLRKSVLKLERATSLVPPDRRKEFREIHDELSSIDNELFHMLFPRQPGSKSSGEK